MRSPRYRVMCIPGQWEDGSDSSWFVFDFKTKRSRLVGEGDTARDAAIKRVWELNTK